MIIKQYPFEHLFVLYVTFGEGVHLAHLNTTTTRYASIRNYLLPVCQSCAVSSAGVVWTNHSEKLNTIINLHKKWKNEHRWFNFDLAPLGQNHTVRFTSDFSIL